MCVCVSGERAHTHTCIGSRHGHRTECFRYSFSCERGTESEEESEEAEGGLREGNTSEIGFSYVAGVSEETRTVLVHVNSSADLPRIRMQMGTLFPFRLEQRVTSVGIKVARLSAQLQPNPTHVDVVSDSEPVLDPGLLAD